MRVGQLVGAGAGAAAPAVPLAADEPASLSRRELLSRLALLGAGAAAAGTAALAGREIVAQPASPPAVVAPAGGSTLSLSAPRVRLEAIGQRPGQLPQLDRPFTASGALVDARGAILGSFAITPLPGAGAVQLHTFELDGGTLLGMGAAKAGEGTFAIIGGTGRYRGAAGTYTARIGADPSGRHGSAAFTFELTGGE